MIQQQQVQATSAIPANVYQQAGAYQLGIPIATYKPLLPSILAVVAMMVGGVIASIVLLIAIAAVTGYLFYILIVIPIAAIIYGVYALIDCDLRVYQFSNGLIRAKGHQAEVIRWDQVISVVQNVRRRGTYYFLGGVIGAAIASSRSSHSFTVQRSDGASFKFNGILKNVAQLGQNIQQAVTQQHMPRAIAAFNAGSQVNFGPLTVSTQGLSNGREVLSWNQVQSVDLKQGQVIVRKVGKTFNWASLNISQVPNLLVFMGLVNYARTGRM